MTRLQKFAPVKIRATKSKDKILLTTSPRSFKFKVYLIFQLLFFTSKKLHLKILKHKSRKTDNILVTFKAAGTL